MADLMKLIGTPQTRDGPVSQRPVDPDNFRILKAGGGVNAPWHFGEAQIAALEGTIDKPAFPEDRLCEGAIAEDTVEELAGGELDAVQVQFLEHLVGVARLGGYQCGQV